MQFQLVRDSVGVSGIVMHSSAKRKNMRGGSGSINAVVLYLHHRPVYMIGGEPL